MKDVDANQYETRAEHEKAIQEAFYEDLPLAVAEIEIIFESLDLTQKQAACVTACVLNRMSAVGEAFPMFATVSLHSALTLQDK